MKAAPLIIILFCVLGIMPRECLAELYIIVNSANTIESVTADQVSRIFLQKTKRFENGLTTEPIAQAEGTKPRQVFNEKILQRNEQQLKYYWSRKMFSGGDRPPATAADDAAVLTRIAEKPGAIGYVGKKPTSTKIKIVLTIGD